MENFLLKLILLVTVGILTLVYKVIRILNIINFESIIIKPKVYYVISVMIISIWIVYIYFL